MKQLYKAKCQVTMEVSFLLESSVPFNPDKEAAKKLNALLAVKTDGMDAKIHHPPCINLEYFGVIR